MVNAPVGAGRRDRSGPATCRADGASNDPNVVPSGGLLIPMLGVGGHCLPKDGILLWWRNIQKGNDTSSSLILGSRLINDASPSYTFNQSEKVFGNLRKKKIALLGVAYRFNSEDTRNSPTLSLANYLRDNNVNYIMHDPYVKFGDQNILKFEQEDHFTQDIDKALEFADYVFVCSAHKEYISNFDKIASRKNIKGIVDACNIYSRQQFINRQVKYSGIGRGMTEPTSDFIDFVYKSFRVVEKALAAELLGLINFYNENYAFDDFNKVKFADVQRFARTCSTGCVISDPDMVENVPVYNGFSSLLAQKALMITSSYAA